MIYRILCIVVLVLILVRPIAIIYEHKDKFFQPGYAKQYESLKTAYYSSQYVKEENASLMPDESFESFVGGAFLRGTNPILIVHEHPPLGRYIIALSILLFDNASTLIPVLLAIALVGIFLIGKMVLGKTLFALLPLVIFANEPLFLGKLYYSPLLEPIQLPFIIFSLYFFIKGVKSKESYAWFILASLMVGFVISIRFFILGAALFAAMIAYLFLRRAFDKNFYTFIFSMPLSLVVLLASYTKTIQDGYSMWQIFSVQKYIFYYHQSKLENLFSFWDLILFNRWHTWWADRRIITDAQWIFLWPISIFLSFFSIPFAIFRKIPISEEKKIISIWVVAYSVLLSIGNTTTRYFLPLLPFLYILSIGFILDIVKLIHVEYKKDKSSSKK